MPTDKLSTTSTSGKQACLLRNAEVQDAAKVLRLVRESQVLDENSCYAYLLLCDHFRETCIVAESQGKLAGFVAAYCPPTHSDSVFVWQIGVASEFRGQGLAKKLLRSLLAAPACESASYLEATVTPDNIPSQSLFKSIASELNVPLETSDGYLSEHFGDHSHQEEQLYRIGPLPADRSSQF